jgi:predicted small metal-binding protein
MSEDSGKRHLTCPCGEYIEGTTEDELVERVQAHLKAEHAGHEYTRDQILFMAT